VGGQRHAPAPLHPRERTGTHIGGWVGPRAGLDGHRKISPLQGFDPRTVQPVASRCTDWAIPALDILASKKWKCNNFVSESFRLSFSCYIAIILIPFAKFAAIVWMSAFKGTINNTNTGYLILSTRFLRRALFVAEECPWNTLDQAKKKLILPQWRLNFESPCSCQTSPFWDHLYLLFFCCSEHFSWLTCHIHKER